MPQQRERGGPAPHQTAAGLPSDLAVARACDGALTEAFNLLGKRWNGMILNALSPGPAGYSELRRALGTITDSVLSDRLTELAAAGLLTRSITDTRPPGVSYALTGAGVALLPVLEHLAQWAQANLGSPRAEDF